MREIIFRGKCQTGEWVFGGFLNRNGKPEIVDWDRAEEGDFTFTTPVDHETIGQYTGLKDKNGKMIFDGDILQGDDDIEDDVFHVARIGQSDENRYECFLDFNGDNTCWMPFTRYFNRMEIIGNIHDQKEDV
jgi:hypothetical protein